MEQGIELLYIGLAAMMFMVFASLWHQADWKERQSLAFVREELNVERILTEVE